MLTPLIVFSFAVAMYLLPAIVASCRGHRNDNAIAAFNTFFGWTMIGWGLALVWALTDNTRKGKNNGN